MIKLKKINWISKEIKEAELYLSDGEFNLVCFSQPFDVDANFSFITPLYTLNANEVIRDFNEEMRVVKRAETPFGYELSGKVIDKENSRIRLGKFLIELDIDLPNDIYNNDYVSFKCERIDVY